MDRHHDRAPIPGHVLDALHNNSRCARIQPWMDPTSPAQLICKVTLYRGTPS